MLELSAVIAAGGRGSRFSVGIHSAECKLLTLIKGHPLLRWSITEALGTGVHSIYILTNEEQPAVERYITNLIENELLPTIPVYILPVSPNNDLRANIVCNIAECNLAVLLASEIFVTDQPLLNSLIEVFGHFGRSICGIFSDDHRAHLKLGLLSGKIESVKENYYAYQNFMQGRWVLHSSFFDGNESELFYSRLTQLSLQGHLMGLSNHYKPISIRRQVDAAPWRNHEN